MPACLCEECLTRHGRVVVCLQDEPCRICGHQPDRHALTVGDIRRIVRER